MRSIAKKAIAIFLFIFFNALTYALDTQYAYNVNWTSLSPNVYTKKITMKVHVGDCTGVIVQQDGSNIPASYNAATKTCMFNVTKTAGTDNTILITAQNYTGGGTAVYSKCTLLNDKKWAYSITFDDGRPPTHDNALSIFAAFGWVAGMAINTGGMTEDWPGWNLSWKQLDNLYNAGWSIMNHSVNHPNLTMANAASELDPVKADVEARYPGYKCNYVVYPYNEDTYWAGVQGRGVYVGAESNTGNNYADTFPPNEPSPNVYRLNRQQLYGTNLTLFNSWASNAANDARPRWLISFSHAVEAGSTSPGTYDTNASTLMSHLTYVNNNWGAPGLNNVWVAPSDVVLDYMYCREQVVVTQLGPIPTASMTHTVSPTVTVTATRTITPSATATVCGDNIIYRINCGGTAFTDSTLKDWSADRSYTTGSWGYVSGTPASTAGAIANTVDDALYQSETYGDALMYVLPVPGNGTYRLRFLFSENWASANGQRVFTVRAEGTVIFNNLDIYRLAGGNFRAIELTATANVADGVLNITTSHTADLPKFGAIEVIKNVVCTSPTNTPTFSATATKTITLTAVPSMTVTGTATATITRTMTATLTQTRAETGTNTPTQTQTITRTAVYTMTNTGTVTQTATDTPAYTATVTGTATMTITQTAVISATVTPTITLTLINPPSLTATQTATKTSTSTHSPVSTATVTRTFTGTATTTLTPTFTGVSTQTVTPTATMTASATWVPTGTSTVVVPSATVTRTTIIPQTPSVTPTLYVPVSTPTQTNTPVLETVPQEQIVLNLYPNPSKGRFKILIRDKQIKVSIYTSSYRLIYRDVIENPSGVETAKDISLNGVANGTYFIYCEAENTDGLIRKQAREIVIIK